jgi:hypothetical protein
VHDAVTIMQADDFRKRVDETTDDIARIDEQRGASAQREGNIQVWRTKA